MNKLTRRQFLKLIATGSGVLVLNPLLSGCSTESLTPTSSPTPGATNTLESPAAPPTTTELPASTTSPTQMGVCTVSENNSCETPTVQSSPTEPAQPAIANPDLVVARQGEPEDLVTRAMAALGGMSKFVSAGAKVIIKPNICTDYYPYEYAATTNPWVVAALVKLCLGAGAKQVQVMDTGFGGSPKKAYTMSGIQEQVEAAGGEMVLMPDFKYSMTDIPQGKDIKKWPVFEDVLTADVVINVPIAKTHGLSRLTLGMKNLMGLVQNRGSLHANLGQRLADLTSLIRPTLTVVDAVRILTANGPTGGNLDDVKKLDTIIASTDIVAADAYATTLFSMQPSDISYIRAGAEMGLGQMDLTSLVIAEA